MPIAGQWLSKHYPALTNTLAPTEGTVERHVFCAVRIESVNNELKLSD
jgi:hypothetical protein